MVQTTLYATDYTQKRCYWTFLIDPQKQKAGLWSVDFATNLCPCTAEVFCGNPYLIAVEGADKGAEIAQLHKNKHA